MTNRIIKFRAWLPKIKKMTNSLTIEEWAEVVPFTGSEIWMQFTGISDESGTPIYEGDIVHVTYKGGYQEECDVFYHNNSCRFMLHTPDGDYGFDNTTRLKVVGNIYENPEYFT